MDLYKECLYSVIEREAAWTALQTQTYKHVTRKWHEHPNDPIFPSYEPFKKELNTYTETRLPLHRFMRHLVCILMFC